MSEVTNFLKSLQKGVKPCQDLYSRYLGIHIEPIELQEHKLALLDHNLWKYTMEAIKI